MHFLGSLSTSIASSQNFCSFEGISSQQPGPRQCATKNKAMKELPQRPPLGMRTFEDFSLRRRHHLHPSFHPAPQTALSLDKTAVCPKGCLSAPAQRNEDPYHELEAQSNNLESPRSRPKSTFLVISRRVLPQDTEVRNFGRHWRIPLLPYMTTFCWHQHASELKAQVFLGQVLPLQRLQGKMIVCLPIKT